MPHFNPLVSVVIITYNQKDFIAECVDSVLSQDYDHTEVIITDDCSTDGTADIIKEYAVKFPGKIKAVFSETNGGITRNCNNGLRAISGNLLTFCAGDDIFLPGKISKQVEWFSKNPGGASCTTDIQVFTSETENGKPVHKFSHIMRGEIYRKGGSVKQIIRTRNQPPSTGFMINRDLCPNLMFDERTPVVSDWLFFVEVALTGYVGYIDGVYCGYRRHENNTTSAAPGKTYLEDRLIYTDICAAKYPVLYRSCKVQRANIFFEAAKSDFFQKNFKLARQRSWSGICEYVFDLRNWALIFATFFGNIVYKTADKRRGV